MIRTLPTGKHSQKYAVRFDSPMRLVAFSIDDMSTATLVMSRLEGSHDILATISIQGTSIAQTWKLSM